MYKIYKKGSVKYKILLFAQLDENIVIEYNLVESGDIMKVAIIGTGNIASVHAGAIKELGHELCIAVNKNIDSANVFAKHWGIKNTYSSIEELLCRDDFDVAHICSPPSYHYEQIKACLLAGKHVISEKPLCVENTQADELTSLAEEKHLVNAVCFNNRFYKANLVARNELLTQKTNLIKASYLQSFHCMPTEYTWRYIDGPAGRMRAVTEIGTHVIDLILFITGKKVSALSSLFIKSNKRRHIENGLMYSDPQGEIQVNSEDAAVINLILENGVIANIVVSEISHGKINELKYRVDCDEKSLCWNSENPNNLNISDKKAKLITMKCDPSEFNDTFVKLFKNVYDHMEGKGTPIYSTFRDASYIVKICNAIYDSASKNGEYIKL